MSHPDAYIRQIVIGGSILDYRYKLYGDINININGDILADGYHAWRMHETYDSMWWRYVDSRSDGVQIYDRVIDLRDMLAMTEYYRLVVSTAPAKQFCADKSHVWEGKQVALTYDVQIPNQDENTIYFNASPDTAWVRSSNVFGSLVTEWPTDAAPEGATIIEKPIFTDCTCTAKVFRTGRFGAWKNETWVDTAYYDTRTALINKGDEYGVPRRSNALQGRA